MPVQGLDTVGQYCLEKAGSRSDIAAQLLDLTSFPKHGSYLLWKGLRVNRSNAFRGLLQLPCP